MRLCNRSSNACQNISLFTGLEGQVILQLPYPVDKTKNRSRSPPFVQLNLVSQGQTDSLPNTSNNSWWGSWWFEDKIKCNFTDSQASWISAIVCNPPAFSPVAELYIREKLRIWALMFPAIFNWRQEVRSETGRCKHGHFFKIIGLYSFLLIPSS